MPQTTPDGFEFEGPPQVAEDLGRTLHGGETGGSPILAEQVQAKFQTTDADLSSLTARVAALEDGTGGVGWIPITSGSETGAEFDLDLTRGGLFGAGAFDMVWLNARFDLNTDGTVRCRINNDSGSGSPYVSGGFDVDSLGNHDGTYHAETDNFIIAYGATVSTNNLSTIFFRMGGTVSHSYQSTSSRQSTNADAHKVSHFTGSLFSTLTAAPSSLRILTGNGASNFAGFDYWLMGLRMEHP